MNHPDLKQQLHAYRPSADSDGSLRASEQLARKDPELNAWLDHEQEFDQLFAQKIQQSPAPGGLRQQILAQAASRASLRVSTPSAGHARNNRSFWLHASFFVGSGAFAASLALFIAFFTNPFAARATPELNDLVAQVQTLTMDLGDLEFAPDYSSLVHLIQSNGAATPSFLPPALDADKSFACKSLNVSGSQVSIICFNLEDATYHLFTLDRSALPNQADLPKPIFASASQMSTAAWTCRKNVYVLAARTDISNMRAQLAQLR